MRRVQIITIFLLLVIVIFHSTPYVTSLSPSGIQVTCGSIIKLQHKSTSTKLHSHNVQYGTGSGQQTVTGFSGSDGNSYWQVLGPYENEASCPPGHPVMKGDVIRLKHVNTGQQEVSCYEGDRGDNWILDTIDGSKTWTTKQTIRLKHKDTSQYLHSHRHAFGHPIPGQLEVTCFPQENNDENIWTAEEGLYYPLS